MSDTPRDTPRDTPHDERYVDAAHRYRLDSRIATGGMGEVWRGTDTALDRVVAVKLLKSEYADDSTFRSRFESEARHAAALHHPGVCAVYDVGEAPATDGSGVPRPFLVMELVDGQPLSELLRGGRRLDPTVMRDLLAQAAEAIGAAHAAGIVHRDVKPANLMVTPDRRIKITDFGIARASDGLGLTGTGQVMGTPQYLSPEQARGNPATPSSDVYSLGVVAWECLAGTRPFERGTPVATALAHLNDPVPSLPDSVPGDLATVVERAMAKDPASRYADGAAFAEALRDPATAATEVVPMPRVAAPVPAASAGSTDTSVMGAVDPVTPAEPVRPVTLPPERRDEGRGGGVHPGWIAAAVIAVALIGLLLYTQLNGDGAPQTPTAPVSSSTPSSATPTPTEETPSDEPSPEVIDLDAADYVGRPVEDVLGELSDLGLDTDPRVIDNPGDEEPDTVESITPTQGLGAGATVTVSYWDVRPEPTPSEEESEDSPEPEQSPDGQPSQSAGPSASQSASQSAQTTSPTPSASAPAAGGNPRRESGRRGR